MDIFNSKKAVSPLIATVLLIAFAVALGIVVMNWGLNLGLRDQDKCGLIDIKPKEINSVDACYSGSGKDSIVRFTLTNTGKIAVTGLTVYITGSNTKSLELDDALIPPNSDYAINDNKITYDTLAYGPIKQIQIIPKIRPEQSTEICPKSAVKIEKIGACK